MSAVDKAARVACTGRPGHNHQPQPSSRYSLPSLSATTPVPRERGLQHVLYPCATSAALAAPTDTTKEN